MFCSHHILLSQKFCLRFHMKRIGEEIKSSKFFYLILFWICFESRSSGETPFMLLSKWQYFRIKYDHSKRKQNSKDFFLSKIIDKYILQCFWHCIVFNCKRYPPPLAGLKTGGLVGLWATFEGSFSMFWGAKKIWIFIFLNILATALKSYIKWP